MPRIEMTKDDLMAMNCGRCETKMPKNKADRHKSRAYIDKTTTIMITTTTTTPNQNDNNDDNN